MTNGRLPDVDSMLPSPTEAVAAWLGAYGVLKKKGITGFAVRQAWRREYFLARQTVIAVLTQQPKRTAVVGRDAWTARYDLEVDAWLIDWSPASRRNGKVA